MYFLKNFVGYLYVTKGFVQEISDKAKKDEMLNLITDLKILNSNNKILVSAITNTFKKEFTYLLENYKEVNRYIIDLLKKRNIIRLRD